MVNLRNDRGVVSGKEFVGYHCSFWMGGAWGSDQYETAVCQETSGCTETNLGECYIFQYWVLCFYRMFLGGSGRSGGFIRNWNVYNIRLLES